MQTWVAQEASINLLPKIVLKNKIALDYFLAIQDGVW